MFLVEGTANAEALRWEVAGTGRRTIWLDGGEKRLMEGDEGGEAGGCGPHGSAEHRMDFISRALGSHSRVWNKEVCECTYDSKEPLCDFTGSRYWKRQKWTRGQHLVEMAELGLGCSQGARKWMHFSYISEVELRGLTAESAVNGG